MLTGPAGSNAGDYFDSINRGFPTPNESGLRTGLTPGGGGSMFPAPSPGSSALFHQLQSGTATPGTLDFHRTAMNAAARSKNTSYAQTSQPQDSHPQQNGMEAHHDATDAANGLFMLAKGGQGNNQFNAPPQPQQPVQSNGVQNGKRNTRNNNGSLGSVDMSANGESPESEEQNSRPATRGGRGKKTAKAEAAANNRRKAEPAPKSSNKRSKGNNGVANVDPNLEPGDEDDEEDMMDSGDDGPQDKKGQTDEEKRRNFLERNRCVNASSFLQRLVADNYQGRRSQVQTAEEAVAR